jgi:iron-sulfur cluster repair protein YtfE (RIC family)
MHETVELIRALAWPCVVVIFLVLFHRQVASLLNELPKAIQRVRSVHAEKQATMISLQLPPVPAPNKTEEGV